MTTLAYALWGALGGAFVEAYEFYKALRVTRPKGWPWSAPDEPGFGPYLASVATRVLMGAGLAAAAGASGQVGGAFGGVGMGVAAPLIIEKLAQRIPRTETSEFEFPSISAIDPIVVEPSMNGSPVVSHARRQTGDEGGKEPEDAR